jgi:hypothetical protein
MLLDSYNGFLIVEPAGSNLGDGEVLAPEAANYELSAAWCPGSRVRLTEARRLLGLKVEAPEGELVASI